MMETFQNIVMRLAICGLCASVILVVASAAFTVHAKTDAELFDDIVQFYVPCCGGDNGSRGREPELIEVLDIGNDTNRLARILVELAQTNSAWYVEMAMWGLEKYGTPAQLPFLYSCATNPAVGDRAVTAVLRIEGVTSNSVAMLQRYLSETNAVSRKEAYNRAVAAREFLDASRSQSVPSDLKETALCVAREFAANVNTSNSIVDEAIVGADESYRFSKRRLAVMRSAYSRCFNEFQTNYVSQVINELVAYPESALPD